MSSPAASMMITPGELKTHPTWTAIHGVVYDLAGFAHPGGQGLLQRLMAKDGTAEYEKAHSSEVVLRALGKERVMGIYKIAATTEQRELSKEETEIALKRRCMPNIDSMLNSFDFEALASEVLSNEAWGYYSSGADDEICLRENRAAFARIRLKPRALVDVSKISMTTTMCGGYTSSVPIYLTATALGKLAHPDGEQAITRAAHTSGVVYMLPTLSSCTLQEMLDARAPNQVVFSQLYVNTDRQRTEQYVGELIAKGVKALFVTVDAPQLGRREKDMRNKFVTSTSDVQKKDGSVKRDAGVTRAISSFIDPSLNWKDIPWLLRIAQGIPVYLKGVQCAEDAVQAFRCGLAGVVVSNHGGRQIDSARSALEVLAEVMPAVKSLPGYDAEKFQVFLDGGVRRGADVFKALALGARAVGIGRPTLYALAAYGQQGVEKILELFKDELEMTMRLMGTPTIKDINEKFVLINGLTGTSGAAVRDFLAESTYEPLQTQADREGFRVGSTRGGRGGAKL